MVRSIIKGSKKKVNERKKISGQIALPFMLLVCGIIIEVAIAGAFIVYYLTNSEAGERFALRAFSAARAGFDDSLLQLSRNKELVGVPNSTSTYSMAINNDSVVISIFRSPSLSGEAYVYTITSTGSAFGRQKKLHAEILVHKVTGELQLRSLTEQPVQ